MRLRSSRPAAGPAATGLSASVLVLLIGTCSTTAQLLTPVHEAGRCAIRGQCGSKGFFGKQLPCLDNGPAEEPTPELRDAIVQLCGAKWAEGDVCCTAEQVKSLKSELSTANQIVSSCPACKDNFFNTFCTFTCSPDQSLFINVTKTMTKAGKTLVTELDQLLSADYADGFYNSCKDVKFGPSNANAMDFIGGGAKNASQFLKFLGDEKAIGSPFQINFPGSYAEPDMSPLQMTPRSCADSDANFRCACVDCPAVCADLAPVDSGRSCRVGLLPCLSFASILTYGVLLLSVVGTAAAKVAWRRHSRRRSERLRLLQDADASDDDGDLDDDDEGLAVRRNGAAAGAGRVGAHGAGAAGGSQGGPWLPDGRRERYYRINTWCDAAFSRLGSAAARFPAISVGTSLLVVVLLSLGWFRFEVERDPARLWVSPASAAAEEKAFFDDNFGPFYRAEKIFLVNDTLSSGPGPVLSYETLVWWMGVERRVDALKGPLYGAMLRDVCFKPTGSACVVQSVAAYFSNEPALVDPDAWRDDLRACAKSPVECRPEYGQPIEPSMILGGYADGGDVADATAMTVTWVVGNWPEDTPEVARAMDWESAMRDFLLQLQAEAAARGLRLSFSTEISLEEELNKSTNTDAKIVVISYVIMFFYASLALGSTTLSLGDLARSPASALVQSKFTLGVAGILIVLMSISASIGLFSWAGVKATLIIAEVIPFIVLAVGVDNIFLIVHEFERVNSSHPDDAVEERVARALGRMGPSILFSALTETASFALGAFVGMPAVRNFAVYAAGAVFINALLQVTMFVSVLALNQMRVEDHRADCFPCLQVPAARIHLNGVGGLASAGRASSFYQVPQESLLQRFIRRTYAPGLLGKQTKRVVVAVFFGLFAAGIALIPEVKLGLDQRVAIPDDSYLIPYFNDLYDYFDAGPPVYFVTRELNATQRATQQEICARFTTCDQLSLTNILEGERKRPDVSYISSPTASWIDDFFLWLNPDLGDSCCVVKDEKGRPRACFAGRDPGWNITLSGMPEGDEFVGYLEKFLASPTTEDCPLGGQASYGTAVVLHPRRDTVRASHFRTSHSPLRSQDDFINAYASARRIASDISAETGLQVFPYSVFYIFFDQYASIVGLSVALLGAAVGIIFVVASVLLGSVLTALVVSLTVVMTIVDIAGAMAVAGVSLNAVSLVNLVICVGIAVEFCAHVARAFMFPATPLLDRAKQRFVPEYAIMHHNNARSNGASSSSWWSNKCGTAHWFAGGGDRDARAWAALVNVGGSVFSGITVTKLLGVAVLAFTRSKIFEIYYFRVWLCLVVLAALHALVFLPVALSLWGGEGYVDPESDGGIEADLAARRGAGFGPGRSASGSVLPGGGGYYSDSDDYDDEDDDDGAGFAAGAGAGQSRY